MSRFIIAALMALITMLIMWQTVAAQPNKPPTFEVRITTDEDPRDKDLEPLRFKRGDQFATLPQSVRYAAAVRGIRDNLVRNGWQAATVQDMYGKPWFWCSFQPLARVSGPDEPLWISVRARCGGFNNRYSYEVQGATSVTSSGGIIDTRTPTVGEVLDRLTVSVKAIEATLVGNR